LKDLWGKKQTSAAEPHQLALTIDKVRQQEGGNILLFSGSSAGDALARLTYENFQPFTSLCNGIHIFDLNSADWWPRLRDLLDEPIWFAASFFGIGQDLITIDTPQGTASLWEAVGIPFLRIYGDIPAYFPDRHIGRFRNSINSYADRSHAEFYQRWFEDKAMSILLPAIPIEVRPLDEVDRQAKLKGPIIFIKNGNDPLALIDYWRNALPRVISQVLEDIGEDCITPEALEREPELDRRIVGYFSEKGLDITANRPLLCYMVAQLDDYIRRIKSTLIAESMLDLPVVIRGQNWGHIDFTGRQAKYDPDNDYARTQSLFDAALAIIDTSPNTLHAPHDRIFRAAGRGTAFLTNYQEYIHHITDNPAECCYRFNAESIANLVSRYLSSPEETIEMGLRQAAAFRAHYSVNHYIEAISRAVNIMALCLGGRPPNTQNYVDFPPTWYR